MMIVKMTVTIGMMTEMLILILMPVTVIMMIKIKMMTTFMMICKCRSKISSFLSSLLNFFFSFKVNII